ncbi:MAG: (2Fe-2S)-binding protein, partial [Planctomycetota bacterium]|nr:(2Fe-2S)-binding protein [Planctomycetota bacterium]MEE3032218.1 (2Fe-2S)-binding protein [Planctomycetota bacterium]
MELDDKLCLCFHVTKRKVVNFLKVNRVRRASQLSECYGAGTGCGWCRPFL